MMGGLSTSLILKGEFDVIGLKIRHLKKEVLIFVTCFVLGLSVLLGVIYYKDGIQKQLDIKKKEVLLMESKYAKAVEDREIISKFGSTYELLVKKGFVGKEQRLEWVADLETTSRLVNIPKLKYHIAPMESALIKNRHVDLKHINVNRSVMSIDFDFVHEGDAFEFFNTLSNKSKALYHIDMCHLKYATSSSNDESTGVLSGNCDLSWYTVTHINNTDGLHIVSGL